MASHSKTLESVLAVLSVLAVGQLSACEKKSQATATPEDAPAPSSTPSDASEAGGGEASCAGAGEASCSGAEAPAEEASCGEGTCAVASLE